MEFFSLYSWSTSDLIPCANILPIQKIKNCMWRMNGSLTSAYKVVAELLREVDAADTQWTISDE
jgi:hypothetical protein